MAQPAAVLQVLVTANTTGAVRGITRVQTQLGATEGGANKAAGAVKTFAKVSALAAGGGIAYAVSKAADFEQQLDSLGSVSGATGRQMERFRKQAMKAGADTKFSALEAAEAQTELAKGGLSVAQIMRGGLRASLALAGAGQLELAEAAESTVNAMKLFSLRGRDAMKVADGLATAANSTTADVSDFALALKQGGSAAKAAGLDFTETVAALEALAEMGIRGSDAGTSLKAALTQLAAPSEKSLGLMEQLGLKFFDAEGNMRPLADVAGMLRRRLGDLTREQRLSAATTLVGTDGMRALLALYDAGPDKMSKFQRELGKQGTALDVSAQKQDNLRGKLENLQGSIETIAIDFGSKLLPVLSDAAEQITDVLNDPNLSASEKFDRFGEMLTKAVGDAAPKVADAAAKVGLVAVRGFFHAFRESPLWLKLLTAGFLIQKLGGFGAFTNMGRRAGGAMGTGMAETAATSFGGRAKSRLFGIGKGLLAGAIVAGIADGMTRADIKGFDRVQQALSTATLGAIPEPRTISDKFKEAIAFATQGGSLTQPGFSTTLLGGLSEGLTDQQKKIVAKLHNLRQTAAKIFGPDAKLRLDVAVNPDRATRQLRMLANEFGRMRSGAVLSVRELRQVTAANFDRIAQTMGAKTKEGQEALAKNFRLGLRSIRDFKERGILNVRTAGNEIARLMKVHTGQGRDALEKNLLSAQKTIARVMSRGGQLTKEGTALIRRLMVNAMQDMGLSPDTIRMSLNKKESAKKGFTQPGQTGLVVTGGKPTGDSVHAILERGEVVVNRKAVQKLGGPERVNRLNELYPRFQTGGMVGYQSGGWVGESPAGLNPAVKSIAQWAISKYPGAAASDTVASRTGSSFHPSGGAVDLVSSNMLAMAQGIDRMFRPKLEELIHTPLGYSVSGGQKVAAYAQEDHYDHVHIAALGRAVKAAKAMVKAAKLATFEVVGLAASPMKSIVQGSLDKVRDAAQNKLNRLASRAGGVEGAEPGPGAFHGGGTPAKNRALGLQMAKARGWGGANWRALDYLWGVGESAWDHTADNPTSSAYGIAQRLLDAHPLQPGEKYMTSPAAQIEWGLDYIAGRYTNPIGALAFWRAQNPHWYEKGGLVGFVGDSLGRGILDYGGFRGKLGKIDLAARAKGGEPSKWGVDQLRQIISPKMGAAVLDMGTNDGTAGNLGPSINAVQGMLGKRPLLMPTIVSAATDAKNKNKLIRQKADKVIPWAANAGKYLTDGIHPFANGGQGVRATMIAQAVKQVVKADKNKPGKKQGRPRKAKKFPGGGPPRWAELGAAVRVLQNSPDKDKRSKALRNVLDHIHAVGLPQGIDTKVDDFTEQASVAAEMVNRASQLTVETADGEVIPGIVGGKTETDWLHAQLEALFKLRNQLVQAENIIRERRERIAELLEKAQRRLDEIADEIRYAAQVRKQIQADLDKAKKHPKKNKRLIGNLKHLLGRIDDDQDGRSRARKGLDRIIGALGGKRENLATSHSDLLTSVNDVQGTGSPLTVMSSLPEVGVLGGQIFDVQMRLRELAAPREAISDLSGSETGESESATLLRELLREANLRTAVSQKQYEVFKGMPPYGGEFATGGVVPGPVGEARTIVAHGGETVVPPGQGAAPVVEINFANGMEWLERFVDVRVDGKTRRDSRIAGRGLPGGRG